MSAHKLIAELSQAVGPQGVGTSQGKCFAWFATTPTASAAGYAKGCIAINTAGGASTTMYVNNGTTASASWKAVTSAA